MARKHVLESVGARGHVRPARGILLPARFDERGEGGELWGEVDGWSVPAERATEEGLQGSQVWPRGL